MAEKKYDKENNDCGPNNNENALFFPLASVRRRYRLGTLATDGAYTPFVCPDTNLWERLFPPKAPVDFGWIQTDKALRLITSPGKPDIRQELP